MGVISLFFINLLICHHKELGSVKTYYLNIIFVILIISILIICMLWQELHLYFMPLKLFEFELNLRE